MADGRGNKKVTNSLVALSSAAVMAVYGAGYARTKAAADRFAQPATDRRARIPAPRDEAPRSAQAVARTAETRVAPVAPIAEPDAAPREARVDARASSPPTTPRVEPPSPRASAAASVIAPVAPPAPIATPSPVAEAQPTTATTSPLPSRTEAQAAAPAQASASIQAPAPMPAPAPTPAPAPPIAALKDGTYYGWGSCRHGDIQAAVVVEAGKIVEARVERCLTRYSCNWVTPIPPRILAKQGTTYDYVSGATESSDAFQDAVAEALSQAKP